MHLPMWCKSFCVVLIVVSSIAYSQEERVAGEDDTIFASDVRSVWVIRLISDKVTIRQHDNERFTLEYLDGSVSLNGRRSRVIPIRGYTEPCDNLEPDTPAAKSNDVEIDASNIINGYETRILLIGYQGIRCLVVGASDFTVMRVQKRPVSD